MPAKINPDWPFGAKRQEKKLATQAGLGIYNPPVNSRIQEYGAVVFSMT
jgi:hypothetical protein